MSRAYYNEIEPYAAAWLRNLILAGLIAPGDVDEELPAVERDCDAGFWDAYDVIPCRDGKARRVAPGTFPLAHGVPARVGKLRAYGNAIVAELGAEFVRAWEETRG